MDFRSLYVRFAPRAVGLALAAIITATAFFSGIYVGFHNSAQVANISVFAGSDALPPSDIDLTPLWKAWNILNERFVPSTSTDPISREEQLWGAIEGLAEAYGDPYTVFMPPVKAAIFEEDINGEFGGVGIEIGMREGVLVVIAPLKDTPADRAGLKSGDRIIEIDGVSTKGLSIDEAVSKIRGAVGTKVTLTIFREGEAAALEFPITRGHIRIPTLERELRDDGVFVIRLYNFSGQSGNLFRDALGEFIKSKSDKLILDLRGNPGGYLEAAVDMASFFIPAGKVIVTEDFGARKDPEVHRSYGYKVFSRMPRIAVLIDGGSASASEILAGALQEHGVATLIGETTFGKGSVQELVKVTKDTSLKVTIARWITPNGHSISSEGLAPDIEVKAATSSDAQIDPPLERAVELLRYP